MNEIKPNMIFTDNTGQYYYYKDDNTDPVKLSVLNKINEDDYNTWTWADDNGQVYTLLQPEKTTGEITEGGHNTWFLNYVNELKYDINNNKVVGGKYTMPAIGLVATSPFWAPYASGVLKESGKYMLLHPVESFVLPLAENYMVNKGADIYEQQTGNEVSQDTRDNISLGLNFVVNPWAMSALRANVTSKFAPTVDGKISNWAFRAMTNGEGGYTQIVRNNPLRDNIVNRLSTAGVGIGIEKTKKALEGDLSFGHTIAGDNILGDGIDMMLDGIIYGSAMRYPNRRVSKVITNTNQATGGAPTSDVAIQQATVNPGKLFTTTEGPMTIPDPKVNELTHEQILGEYFFYKYNDPAFKKLKTKNEMGILALAHERELPLNQGKSDVDIAKGLRQTTQKEIRKFAQDNLTFGNIDLRGELGKSYQLIYEMSPTQQEYNLRLHSYNTEPEKGYNLYEETSADKELKIGLQLANGLMEVKGMFAQGLKASPSDAETFFAKESLETTGYKDRFGKGARVYVLTDHKSDSLPDIETMKRDGWQIITLNKGSSVSYQPIGGKSKYLDSNGDWIIGSENGNYQRFNANGHNTTYLRAPNGEKYAVQIDFGGSGSASGGITAKDVSLSGQHPIITVHVEKTTLPVRPDKKTDLYGTSSVSKGKMAAENFMDWAKQQTNSPTLLRIIQNVEDKTGVTGSIAENQRNTQTARYETDDRGYIKRELHEHTATKDSEKHKEGDVYYTSDKIKTEGYKAYLKELNDNKKKSLSEHEDAFFSDLDADAKVFAKMRPSHDGKYNKANKAKIEKLSEEKKQEYISKGYINPDWLMKGGKLIYKYKFNSEINNEVKSLLNNVYE